MMTWKVHYGQRITSADEAVEVIKSGDHVALGNACGEPLALFSSLLERARGLKNIEVVQFITFKSIYTNYLNQNVSFNTFFINIFNRSLVNSGRINYIPCLFSAIPRLFKEKHLKLDVAMIQISPPDENGYCSLGVSVDFSKALIDSSKTVLAEVNPRMPRTLGDTLVHVSQIDYFVPNDSPLLEISQPYIGPVEEAIGKNVAGLIEDGSTLQMGMGSIYDAVLSSLKDKNDLGIHSEVITDSVIGLIKSGTVSGRRKTLHQGKVVGSFLVGTSRLYDFADFNPVFELYPIDYTSDPYTIGLNEKMISISCVLQADLTGQVCFDTIGQIQFGGMGSHADFVRGASRSKGGKSIIVLPSTTAGGKLSRIAIYLDVGASVSTLRDEVHFVVTEYGIADLRGKTLKQRAEALINIAHPDFRDYLRRGV